MQAAISDIEERMAAGLASIRDNFVDALDRRVDRLEAIVDVPVGAPLSKIACEQIKFVAHKTLGTAATLGFGDLGKKAADLETAVQDCDAVNTDALNRAVIDFLNAADMVVAQYTNG